MTEIIRIRLGAGEFVEVSSPGAPAKVLPEAAPSAPKAVDPPVVKRPFCLTAEKPVIALIEAVPAGAVEIAAGVVSFLEAAGYRVGVLCLDGQNRLGDRLGRVEPSPSWCWKQATPELLVRQGLRVLVSGPAAEAEVSGEAVESVLHRVREATDAVLVDLGCRWEPRLFRPVLLQAEHIWLLTRPGQWTGAEMRLEQAEFSGWTEMRRVRLVLAGHGATPPAGLGAPVAGVLTEPFGEAVESLLLREVGRVPR